MEFQLSWHKTFRDMRQFFFRLFFCVRYKQAWTFLYRQDRPSLGLCLSSEHFLYVSSVSCKVNKPRSRSAIWFNDKNGGKRNRKCMECTCWFSLRKQVLTRDVLVSGKFPPREVTFVVNGVFQRSQLWLTRMYYLMRTCFYEVEISLPEAETSTPLKARSHGAIYFFSDGIFWQFFSAI